MELEKNGKKNLLNVLGETTKGIPEEGMHNSQCTWKTILHFATSILFCRLGYYYSVVLFLARLHNFIIFGFSV